MIYFELDNVKYRIRFRHWSREQMVEEKMAFPRSNNLSVGSTVAVLSRFENEAWVDIDFGQSYCHPKDHFDKACGRKLAMANLFCVCALFKAGPGRYKSLREKVWRLYFDKASVKENVNFLTSQLKQEEKK